MFNFLFSPLLRSRIVQPNNFSLFLTALALSLSLYLLQGDTLFGLADESFLWYGAWRTSLGEVPIRDFYSYDPGRYYWSGLWIYLFGNSIETLRLSTAAFQAIGLLFGLLLLRELNRRWWFLLLGGAILCIWMYPRYKPFEPALTLAATWFAFRLFQRPNLARHFQAGVFVGLAAWFGRNHGVYSLVSFALVLIITFWKIDRTQPIEKLIRYGLGIVVGYSPMLVALALAPGLFQEFLYGVIDLFRLGTTNVHHDIPWPWLVLAERIPTDGIIVTLRSKEFIIGTMALLWPIFVGTSLIYVATRKYVLTTEQRLLSACAAVAFSYYHYLVARPIVDYLTMSIGPVLIAAMTMPFIIQRKSKFRDISTAFSILALIILTYYFSGKASYLYKKYNLDELEKENIAGSTLLVKPYTAKVLRSFELIKINYLGANDEIVVLPFWPSAYLTFNRPSPIREIYFMWPQREERQRKIIDQIDSKKVKYALIGDWNIENDESWRMQNSNPLVWRYFQDNYSAIPLPELPRNYQFMVRNN